MKILFIGDIVGRPGRRAVEHLIPQLRDIHQLDVVIANGENAAGGAGITPKTAGEIFAAGVDVMTSGDHLWDQKEVVELLKDEPRFVRPINYPADTIGSGVTLCQKEGLPPIGVINAQGRDKRGQGTARGLIEAEVVAEGDAQTKVNISNDIEITGKAAQFGRGILQDVSKEIMADFARNLEEMLTGPDAGGSGASSDAAAAGGEGGGAAAAAGSGAAAARPTPAPAGGSNISAVGLMGRVAKRRAKEQPVVTGIGVGVIVAVIVVIVLLIV